MFKTSYKSTQQNRNVPRNTPNNGVDYASNSVDVNAIVTKRFDKSKLPKRNFLDKGAYGEAYVSKATSNVKKYIESIVQIPGTDKMVENQEIVIKAQTVERQNGDDIKRFIREAYIHARLRQSGTVELCGRSVSAKDYVPEFYGAGLYYDDQNQHYFLIFMERIPGKTLHEYKSSPEAQIKGNAMQLYLHVERAACSLWVQGIVHADFHGGNVLVNSTPHGLQVKIIDFGFAIYLPGNMGETVKNALTEGIKGGATSLAEIFGHDGRIGLGINKYTNKVMKARMKARQNAPNAYAPNGQNLWGLLQLLINKDDRKNIPEERRKFWGCDRNHTRPTSWKASNQDQVAFGKMAQLGMNMLVPDVKPVIPFVTPKAACLLKQLFRAHANPSIRSGKTVETVFQSYPHLLASLTNSLNTWNIKANEQKQFLWMQNTTGNLARAFEMITRIVMAEIWYCNFYIGDQPDIIVEGAVTHKLHHPRDNKHALPAKISRELWAYLGREPQPSHAVCNA